MKATETNKYYIFENNNRYSKEEYNIIDAIKCFETLRNCKNTTDCKFCENVNGAFGCEFVINAINCVNCSRCYDIANVYNVRRQNDCRKQELLIPENYIYRNKLDDLKISYDVQTFDEEKSFF